jgi:hypothetical protein
MKNPNNTFKTTKEHLHLLKFSSEDVATSEIDRRRRSTSLIRAMRLGNLFKNKVSIYFRDSLDRLIYVRTTIWGVTQQNVILKKGTLIPIHSIERVE